MKLSLPRFNNLAVDHLDLGRVLVGEEADGPSTLRISDHQLRRHIYTIGSSGAGKSGFLQAIAFWNVLRSYPFLLLDPVGTLFTQVLRFIGALNLHLSLQERSQHPGWNAFKRRQREAFLRRFVVLDFTDPTLGAHAKGFGWRYNPLQPQDGLTASETVGDFLRCLERVVGDLVEMRRLQFLLRSVCTMLVELGGTTLRDVPDLLLMEAESVRDYVALLQRRRSEGRLSVPVRPTVVEQFMSGMFAAFSPKDRRDYISSSKHAISLFLTDPPTARFVSSPTSTISFSDIVNGGKTLLVRLPAALDHNTQRLLGAMILNRIQLVAERRSIEDVQAGRVPQFSCIVDEFHNYFTEHLTDAIARTRNVGLNFVVSHQSFDQFVTDEEKALLRAFKANASTQLYFRVGTDDAKIASADVFSPQGLRRKRIAVDETESHAVSWSRTKSQSITKTISEALGESSSQTVTFSVGENKSVSFQESKGVSRVQTTGITLTQGENWSRAEAHGSGTSVTITGSETITETQGVANSRSTTRGSTTDADGRMGSSLSTTIGETISHARALARGSSRADGVSETSSTTNSSGGSESTSVSRSLARGLTLTKGMTESLGRSATRSQARQVGESRTRTRGSSVGSSTAVQHGGTRTQGRTRKEELYTLEEETQLGAQELRAQPHRHAWVKLNESGGLRTALIRTHDIEQNFVTEVGGVDYVADFLRICRPPPAEPEPSDPLTLRLFDERRKDGGEP